MKITDKLLQGLIGWRAGLIYGDPCVLDRWRWLRAHLLPGGRRTLDAGCGTGVFSIYAGTLGNSVLGVSIDPASVNRATERARALGLDRVKFMIANLKDIEDTPVGSERFDQVLCLETIEHILDDRRVLRSLSGLLKEDGRLLLTTPYKFYRPMHGDRLSDVEDGGHVRWGYTHEEMTALLDEAGLEVTERGYLSGVVNQQLTNLLRLLGRAGPAVGWVATAPLRPLAVLDRWLTRLSNTPYLSIAVVARRRAIG